MDRIVPASPNRLVILPYKVKPAPLLNIARVIVVGGWCRGAWAENRAGEERGPYDPHACRWCLGGALLVAYQRQTGLEVEPGTIAPPRALQEALQSLGVQLARTDPERARTLVLQAEPMARLWLWIQAYNDDPTVGKRHLYRLCQRAEESLS